jgi:hypothetical protein
LEDWKIKISVLWLFSGVAFLGYVVMKLMEPGVMAGAMAGKVEGMKIGPGLILLFSIYWLVPLIMAFLTLTLKDSVNRWANMILGAVFAASWCVDLVEAVIALDAWATLALLSTVVALILIVWYAWKSKQKV